MPKDKIVNQMPKAKIVNKTDLLDKSDTNTNKKKAKLKYDRKKAGKITIKKYCANYKHDYLGKHNKSLYNACKINQYCRKTKCKDIDSKFDKIKNNKQVLMEIHY